MDSITIGLFVAIVILFLIVALLTIWAFSIQSDVKTLFTHVKTLFTHSTEYFNKRYEAEARERETARQLQEMKDNQQPRDRSGKFGRKPHHED